MKIHLTYTGYYAGQPLCGVNKPQAYYNGDTFYHAMYWHDWDNPDVCNQCKEIWFATDDDEDDTATGK